MRVDQEDEDPGGDEPPGLRAMRMTEEELARLEQIRAHDERPETREAGAIIRRIMIEEGVGYKGGDRRFPDIG